MSFEKIEIIIPKKLENFSNTCLSMGAALSRWQKTKSIQKEVMLRLRAPILSATLPVKVTLTRVAPRPFDDDNLRHAFKHIKDGISGLFFPNMAIGKADDFDCFEWAYKQEKGEPKKYAIKIEIEGR